MRTIRLNRIYIIRFNCKSGKFTVNPVSTTILNTKIYCYNGYIYHTLSYGKDIKRNINRIYKYIHKLYIKRINFNRKVLIKVEIAFRTFNNNEL